MFHLVGVSGLLDKIRTFSGSHTLKKSGSGPESGYPDPIGETAILKGYQLLIITLLRTSRLQCQQLIYAMKNHELKTTLKTKFS